MKKSDYVKELIRIKDSTELKIESFRIVTKNFTSFGTSTYTSREHLVKLQERTEILNCIIKDIKKIDSLD